MAVEKANLHLIGRRIEPLEAVAAQARGWGVEATCHCADLASESGQLDLARGLVCDLGQVDNRVHAVYDVAPQLIRVTGTGDHAPESDDGDGDPTLDLAIIGGSQGDIRDLNRC